MGENELYRVGRGREKGSYATVFLLDSLHSGEAMHSYKLMAGQLIT